ncbi:hypothetical protein AGRA3207_007380 [Actinomadura graeca]|uniref:Transposase n=1 Tax=Actinomadura graeca TaxID=2750812 RepID=A0ABX8RA13_9ACTN|nr:hypothetical protein [Actinomadura graeca]QXJ25823.1 hypothetical protein AGRA3207_007380 [Actinomadura graeca]
MVPVHDRTITSRSKNHQYSVNMQVVIDADTRLVVAVGRPVPGNHNDREDDLVLSRPMV